MTTVINTPRRQDSDTGLGFGVIVGMILAAILLGVLFFMYGLPALGGGNTQSETQNIEVQVPATTPEVTTPAE